jgi:hypothetical protein
MASKTHMAAPEDDVRHAPTDDLPNWNESYWFPFYDPKHEIGVAMRFGMLPNRGYANVYVLITQGPSLVYSMIDQRAPLPPGEKGRLSAAGYTIEFLEPLDKFRVTFDNGGATSIDVTWEGFSPTALWPHPPGATFRHIEHAGAVRGTVTIGGKRYEIDCLGHRDHSFGAERNWDQIAPWSYLSGEFDKSFWFNAAKISFPGLPQPITIGCLFDGGEVMIASNVRVDEALQDGGTRQAGVEVRMTDEKGREHHITGETLASANVWFGPTCLREGVARWKYGDRTGYGVYEYGFNEGGTRNSE